MFRAEDQRPSPESLLSDPVLRFFQTGLSDPDFVPNTHHIPALCLGLSLHNEEHKGRCLRLLLGLLQEVGEVEVGDQLMEVDLRNIVSAVKVINLSSEARLIPTIFELCRKQLKRKPSLISLKRSGVSGLMRQCLNAMKNQSHPRVYLPILMQFAKECDLTTCICAIYDAKLISYHASEGEEKEFVLATCYRCGNRAIDAIIKANRSGRWIDRAEALENIRKAPLHVFKHRSRSEQPLEERLLKELLQEPQHVSQKVADVTSFLTHILQGLQLRSFMAMRGICFSSPLVGVRESALECEMGYFCRACQLQICQTCLLRHRTHEVEYVGRVVCQEPGSPTLSPLFEALDMPIESHKYPIETVTGPGQRTFLVFNSAEPSATEQLTTYLEFYVAAGGDTDDFKLSAGEVLYSAQIGRIETQSTVWPAPMLSQGDVVGFGVTSRSRAILTFNGILHPAVFTLSTLLKSVTISLDDNCKVKVKSEGFLFDSAVAASNPLSLKSEFQASTYSKSFWTQMEDTLSHCPSQSKAEVHKWASQSKKGGRNDPVSNSCRDKCKACSLF